MSMREEELKNKIAQEYFAPYDCTRIIGNIDFCVGLHEPTLPMQEQAFLWAEAKAKRAEPAQSITQLILTIGKARTHSDHLPPSYLGAFDTEAMAFVEYHEIAHFFSMNDFNWNVTPSDYSTREFGLVYERVKNIIGEKSLEFRYDGDHEALLTFIRTNFVAGKLGTSKIQITKNNFTAVYNRWREDVMPSIALDWDMEKELGIVDADFYLADLLSLENETIREKLNVILKKTFYNYNEVKKKSGGLRVDLVTFNDGQKAHTLFWNKYERPPAEEYWEFMITRRDLLVPKDVRERKGSYFTPARWVDLSQQYIADVLGENWQEEYYVWDCAAGTGNLLAGLTEKYRIFASTIDKADVDVMKSLIKDEKANLLEDHVFQFDFLNDEFTKEKMPKLLYDIIQSPAKRKKLLIYINPPYAEASNRATVVGLGQNKASVATTTRVYKNEQTTIGTAARELFAQFLIRIYKEIPTCKIAEFSKLKILQAPNFWGFREKFEAKLEKMFVVPSNTFDNVKGQFPIGFMIWDLNVKQKFRVIESDVYDQSHNCTGNKKFYAFKKNTFIINWLRNYYDKKSERIAFLRMQGTDMQNNRGVYFTNKPSKNDIVKRLTADITRSNIREMCIYLSMRHLIKHSWLNDRDQFLYPNNGWKTDKEFQNNCLTYAVFHGQNKVSSKGGTNHWIPFTDTEVDARTGFVSTFMTDYMAGKIKADTTPADGTLGGTDDSHHTSIPKEPLVFSAEATAVFDAGRQLWRYYHTTATEDAYNVNASLYDIREYYQRRKPNGRMNSTSSDEQYMHLIKSLRSTLEQLARKLEPKVYDYGFLKR